MDVDRFMTIVKPLDGNSEKPKQFMLSSGMTGSALEHSVPEQLFSTKENPAYGISAVKALQIANEQRIPIYTINQTNINTILPKLQLDPETINCIKNAVNAGKEVTISKTNITFNGWTGCGYIIIDPTTGAGAYMISGGMNGGHLLLAGILLFWAAVFVILAVITSETVIGAFVFGFMGFAFSYGGIVVLYGKQAADEFIECILALAIIHTIFDSIRELALSGIPYSLRVVLFEILIVYFLSKHAIDHFRECLEGLYGHLSP